MPIYRGKEISDDDLQALLDAYRDGYTAAGCTNVEDSDQPILDRLEEDAVETRAHARRLGHFDCELATES